MIQGRHIRVLSLFLAVLAMGVIWVVGMGEATPQRAALVAQATGETPEGGDAPPPRLKKESLYKNIKLLNDIAFRVQGNYMDEIDNKDMVYSGIRGMLDILDPFSVLMERRTYDNLMEGTRGKYEGLGMQIDMRNDTITVVSPIEGTPADRVGLSAGDRIVEIEGESTIGMTTEEASKRMRGPAGTSITLKIVRYGLPEALDFEVERAVIELKSVTYYGIADEKDRIGYVRLSKFAESTNEELHEAIDDLNTQGARSLILDLRSNGGGLLDQAVKTANLFLDRDRLIVYTQGRDPGSQRKYFSREKPLFPDKPLVILVDHGTASASEIVSGAVQDWDRGLIVGNTTFGKGLVQQIFTLPETDDVALKLTTARYYVPSGRLIQKPQRSTKHPEELADSLVESEEDVFFTNNGRKVYGGGGIVPDIDVEPRSWKPILINLERRQMFFDFAVQYTSKHPDLPKDFEMSEEIVDEFRSYLKDREFDYKTAAEVQIEQITDALGEIASKEELYADALDEMRALVDREKDLEFDESREFIERALRREIISKLHGQRGVYEELVMQSDPYVMKALELLRGQGEYKRLLASNIDD